MSEMKLPIIITKENCSRCHDLKEWLNTNDIQYVEKDINDEDFVHQLLNDENFLGTFCDADGCIVNTPVVMYKGKYIYKELFGISGLRKKEAEKIFGVN